MKIETTNKMRWILALVLAVLFVIFVVPRAHGQISGIDPNGDGTHVYSESNAVSVSFDAAQYPTANVVIWQIWDNQAKIVVPVSGDTDGSDGWNVNMTKFQELGERGEIRLQALIVDRAADGSQSILGRIDSSTVALTSTAPTPDPDPTPDPTPDPDPDPTPDPDPVVDPVPELMLVVARGEDSESGIIYANFVGFDFPGADEFVFPIDSVKFNWDDGGLAIELAQARADIDETQNLIIALQNEIAALKAELANTTPTPDPDPDPDPIPDFPININTADKATLIQLPGVASTLADRIIAARPFASTADIVRVRGIGSQTAIDLAPLITVESETP